MSVEHAVALGKRGLRVFPVIGKEPARKGWQQHASSDEAAIRSAWAKHPDANPAVATGGELYVLDADTPEAVGYLESVGLTGTLRVRTGRGQHFYTHKPAEQEIRNASGQTIAAGVDGRGEGGYVVSAGAVHPDTGQPYEWIDPGAELLALPAEIAERLAARQHGDAAEITDEALAGFAAVAAAYSLSERAEMAQEAQRAVARVQLSLSELPAQEGNGRGDKFFGHAQTLGQFVGAGVLGPDEAREVLNEAAVPLCFGASHHVWRSIDRGLAKGAGDPVEPELADFGGASHPQTERRRSAKWLRRGPRGRKSVVVAL